ncbi:MAG: NUDIX domain-containing protein [Fibrobacterota bacterium]
MRSVGAAVLLRKGKVLLAQRDASKGGVWEFPGGKIEQGESLFECVIREVREELSMRVIPRRMLCRVKTESGFEIFFVLCFTSDSFACLHEHIDCKWVSPRRICDYSLAETNKIAVPFIPDVS